MNQSKIEALELDIKERARDITIMQALMDSDKDKLAELKKPKGNDLVGEIEPGIAGKFTLTNPFFLYGCNYEFKDETAYRGFLISLNIYLEWLSCEGVVAYEEGVYHFRWGEGGISQAPEFFGPLSPRFSSREACEASVELIGRERIKQMREGFILGV